MSSSQERLALSQKMDRLGHHLEQLEAELPEIADRLHQLDLQKQQKMISESIRSADTTKLAPPLNETELIQQLVGATAFRS